MRPLRTRASFDWVARKGRRSNGTWCWLRYAAAAPEEFATDAFVGYAIGRKVGPAVTRNRIRRRLRAAMREVEHGDGLTPGYYLFGVRSSAAATAPFEQLCDDVTSLIDRAALRTQEM